MPDFPTTLVPTDVAAPITALGNVSKNHTDHHQAVDERLGELQAALGKLDTTGFARNGPQPTFFDPGVATWDLSAFLSIFYDHTGDNQSEEWTWGSADGSANFLRLLLATSTGQRQVAWTAESDSDSGNKYVIANMNASINRDGTGREVYYHVESDLGGEANLWSDDDGTYLQAKGNPGQTEAILDCQTSAGAKVIEATGDSKIGFYNKAPVALQTGVAVNAAGIHAALVNLGLITA